MKRDFELLRKIVLSLDRSKETSDELEHHLRLLEEGGLIQLTDEGQELAALCRDEALWQEMKKRIEDAGLGLSYWLLRQILETAKTQRIL